MDAIQVWPDLMGIAGDLVAKAQDWPGADKLAERLKKTIPPQFLSEEEQEGTLGVTPEQIQQMQIALQEGAAQMAELEQQLKDKTIEHQIALYNAETQRIRALSDNMVDDQELQRKGIETILKYSAEVDKIDLQAEKTSTPSGPSASPAG